MDPLDRAVVVPPGEVPLHSGPGREQALTRVFDVLTPDERHTVLATGINRLLASRARRNGTVPDTLFVADDGTFHLIQPKHYRHTAPPGLAAVLQAQHA
ncbi:hypothetical protein [Streptomyces sp. NBC_00989]|uniref:hypothetical protein n=1 Tax=Streptomyces sp. NBC_00989 TaxID=2903705 RepID=UPI002F90C5F2|nr:hypothetical protein OG714_54175 [Streptomyces sp. NBC_00989]